MGSTKKKIYTFIRNIFMLFPESIIRKYEKLIENKLRNQFYSNSNSLVGVNTKFIISIFDSKINSGGLSDRINGIISAFKISQILGIDFKIKHDEPFKIESFLMPNFYNWKIPDQEISYNSVESKPIFIRSIIPPRNNKRQESFIKAIMNDSSKKQFHSYSNLKIFSNDEFRKYFNQLFIPSNLLKGAIDDNLNKIGSRYISITFRFQQLLGDFEEGNFPTLSEIEKNKLISKCLVSIKDISNRYPSYNVLVTSDSVTFIQEANKLPNVYTIPGKVVHMAFTHDNSEKIHLKSFLDLFMIANADEIFLVKSKLMYDSGFPFMASMIYGKPFNKILI